MIHVLTPASIRDIEMMTGWAQTRKCLYAYGEVESMPEGVEVRNALPVEHTSTYQGGTAGRGYYSGFASLWGFHPLYKRGGRWADTDVVRTRSSAGLRAEVVATSPEGKWGEPAGGHALHLWTNVWRQNGLDNNVAYPSNGMYGRLKRRYLHGAG